MATFIETMNDEIKSKLNFSIVNLVSEAIGPISNPNDLKTHVRIGDRLSFGIEAFNSSIFTLRISGTITKGKAVNFDDVSFDQTIIPSEKKKLHEFASLRVDKNPDDLIIPLGHGIKKDSIVNINATLNASITDFIVNDAEVEYLIVLEY